jgi:hypothetical protein
MCLRTTCQDLLTAGGEKLRIAHPKNVGRRALDHLYSPKSLVLNSYNSFVPENSRVLRKPPLRSNFVLLRVALWEVTQKHVRHRERGEADKHSA